MLVWHDRSSNHDCLSSIHSLLPQFWIPNSPSSYQNLYKPTILHLELFVLNPHLIWLESPQNNEIFVKISTSAAAFSRSVFQTENRANLQNLVTRDSKSQKKKFMRIGALQITGPFARSQPMCNSQQPRNTVLVSVGWMFHPAQNNETTCSMDISTDKF